ncbi:hypothetical protein PS706_03315 [Pseudomonas fluorescens]|nr:hypothetical protein PS706_03315 [Pseudomonas fluorescens]
MGGEVGIDLHTRPEQGDIATVRHAERPIDVHLLLGSDFDRAQPGAIELIAVEQDLALAIGRQHSAQVQAVGDFLRVAVDQHLVGRTAQGIALRAGGFVVDRNVLANDQLRTLGPGFLGLLVAVEVDRRCLGLAITLEHITDHLAFQYCAGGTDDQLAGIAAHGVTGFIAALGSDQRVVVRLGLAPADAGVFIALVETGVENVARRFRHLIQAAIRALEPGLLNVTSLHIHGAARQVDLRALLGHRLLAGKGHGAALGHPFAHRVALGAEVAAHFQQAAGRVPTVGGVAVGAGRHEHQLAQIDPHIIVDQLPTVAVDRRIALLIALHVDLDGVGLHRHLDADGTRHVDHRAIAHQAALAGADRYLAAGGQRDRALLEVHGAAADNLDARLIGTVNHSTEVIELPGDQVGGRAVELDQTVVFLAVEGRAAAGVEQDRGGAAFAQGHAAAGVAGGVEQVNRAACIHRGAGQGHAVLLHLVAGQGDVAGGGHDQAAVGDVPRGAAGLEAGRHFVATGGGAVVARRTDALANVKAVAGRQGGLALGSDDSPGVFHFAAQQQGIAA